ncbi:MAG: aspartate/glutamate racemase family protein, partial [Propylenella sp.]
MPDAGPMLVFDSGIGGLSVLSAVRAALPDARFVYVADDAAFPYGDWEEAALREHIVELMGKLIAEHHPAAVVIACNTASTLVLPPLRERFSVPFVGTVPAIKPAAEQTKSGVVAVLATPGTMKRDYTRDLIRSFAGAVHVRLV